jgi:O-antigen/teichoic acid export membrane protein
MNLKTSIAINLIGSLVPVFLALACIPPLIHKLGMSEFGILSLVWILIGYLSIFDMGVGRALTFEVSNKLKGETCFKGLSRTICPGISLATIAGILGVFLILPIIFFMGSGLEAKFNIEKGSIDALYLCVIAIVPTAITSAIRGALEGGSRFIESNLMRAAISSGMFIVPLVFVELGNHELLDITIGLIILRIIVMIISIYIIRDNIKLNHFIFRRSDFRMLHYGSWVTISSILSPLMVNGDRFIVSSIVGPALLNLYTIPQEMIQRFLIVPGAFTTSIFPKIPHLKSIKNFYKINLFHISTLSFISVLCIAFIGPYFFEYWISPVFAINSQEILWILCFGLFFNSLAQLPMTYLMAMGMPKLVTTAHVIELIFYVLAIYILVKIFGVKGAAYAWSFRVSLDFFILNYFVRKFASC